MSAGLVMAAIMLGLLLAVLWIALPFAVFGVKPLLAELLREQRRTNDLLQRDAGGKQ